jgi:iron complex outermembrane receptor protein
MKQRHNRRRGATGGNTMKQRKDHFLTEPRKSGTGSSGRWRYSPVAAAIGLAIGATTIAGGASAQEASARALEEIVVTATRRDESVQDIPVNISVLSVYDLEESRVTSLSDLSQLVAGMSFADVGPTSRSNIVLRGINANATNSPSLNTVQPVSTYVGETPIFLSLQIRDIERVEVLRGPQGTLYGSGSLAGTIRFIPARPDPAEFSAMVEVEFADVSATDKNDSGLFGVFNIPMGETSALRVSAGWQKYAGFIDENYIVALDPASSALNSPAGIPTAADPNDPLFSGLVFNPVENANDVDVWHVRASWLFEPNDKFSSLLTYHHQEDETFGSQAHAPNFEGNVDTPPAQNVWWSPAHPSLFPTGGTVFAPNDKYDANNSFLLQSNRKTDLFSLDVTYDFGFATMTSSTSYYKDGGETISDNTGLLTLYSSYYGFIPRMVDYQTTFDETNGFVQELRLVSNSEGRFDYVIGVFYQDLDFESGQLQWIPGQTLWGTMVGNPGGNAATLGDLNVIGSTTTNFQDIAVFGELTWHVTDQWQVTGGVRAFNQDFSIDTSVAFPFCGLFCSNINDDLGTTFVSEQSSAHDQILKINTSYAVNDDLNLYLNFAEGFRRGGSSGIPISGPFAGNPALLMYDPDKTRNYEIGAKGKFGSFSYSLALFHIDWDHFQVDDNAAASGFSIAVNGATAESDGLEFELNGALTDNLFLRFGYAYADARVAEDFQVIDFAFGAPYAIISSLKGDRLPNSPRQSATVALDYTHQLLQDWNVRWHLNGSYRSDAISQLVSTTPTDPPPFKIDSFSIVNVSVNLSNENGLSFGLFVDNVSDELGMTGGTDRGAVGLRAEQFFVGRPRTVGVRVRHEF